MSTFKAACLVCGLSQALAAEFFDVNPVTVKRWFQNREEVPEGVWKMLANHFSAIEESADHAEHVMLMDGIDPFAYSNIEASFDPNDPLPKEAAAAAGAIALLRVLADRRIA